MSETALVVPPATDAPLRRATYELGQLNAMLYREIGTEPGNIDCSSTIATTFGEFRFWTADDALLTTPIVHNDRVLALVRTCGYQAPDVGGTIVLTGAVVGGQSGGLTEDQLHLFEQLLAPNPDFPPMRYERAEIQLIDPDDAMAYLNGHLGVRHG
jgi:hypothetical protein